VIDFYGYGSHGAVFTVSKQATKGMGPSIQKKDCLTAKENENFQQKTGGIMGKDHNTKGKEVSTSHTHTMPRVIKIVVVLPYSRGG
jgi:hypothetical protein